MINPVMTTIDLDAPINCDKWERCHDHQECHNGPDGKPCRFLEICKAKHEEVG